MVGELHQGSRGGQLVNDYASPVIACTTSYLANAVPVLPNLFNEGASTLLFLPLTHVFSRVIQVGCVRARVRFRPRPRTRAPRCLSCSPRAPAWSTWPPASARTS